MATLRQIFLGLRALDPSLWRTGLSTAGARLAWREELDRVEEGLKEPDAETAQTLEALDAGQDPLHLELEGRPIGQPPTGQPGQRTGQGASTDQAELKVPGQTGQGALWIWCAANVFTAPLRWLVFGALSGRRVVLKAPSAAPESVVAMGAVFGVQVVVSSQQGLASIKPGDRVLGFGSDGAMAALEAALPAHTPRSLHGHRVSFAVVQRPSAELAQALAWDAAIFDGQGCMSPAGVFVMGEPMALAKELAAALERLAESMPRGPMAPSLGPAWRRRTGLARILGACFQGADWAVPVLPLARAEALVLPRMLPVHPLVSLEQLAPLGALPLSSLALDGARPELAFTRWVAPGAMQRPQMSPIHEGVNLVELLLL